MGPQKEKNLGALFTLVVLGLEMQGILCQNCCIMNKIAAKHVVSLPVRKEKKNSKLLMSVPSCGQTNNVEIDKGPGA